MLKFFVMGQVLFYLPSLFTMRTPNDDDREGAQHETSSKNYGGVGLPKGWGQAKAEL